MQLLPEFPSLDDSARVGKAKLYQIHFDIIVNKLKDFYGLSDAQSRKLVKNLRNEVKNMFQLADTPTIILERCQQHDTHKDSGVTVYQFWFTCSNSDCTVFVEL